MRAKTAAAIFLAAATAACSVAQTPTAEPIPVAPVADIPETTLPAQTSTSTFTDTDPDALFLVVEVVDGDTIGVGTPSGIERVRLIGIDAPEGDECLSSEAKSLLTDLILGAEVRLELDVSDRDRYGRWLRYAYVDDQFVNEVLVREGLAIARRYEPDTSLSGVLEQAEEEARKNAVGLWNKNACGPGSDHELVVLQIQFDAPGDDNGNLNEEWVEFQNQGTSQIDLTGWTVKDESATHRYPFPAGFILLPNASVRLHTGCGRDTPSSLFWCNTGSAVWNNSGDTVFLIDPAGNVALSFAYSG